MSSADAALTRTAASRAVEALGWRYLLGTLCASVPVDSMRSASSTARSLTEAAGDASDGHLRIDLRPERVELWVQTTSIGTVTGQDVGLVERLSAELSRLGLQVARIGADGSDRPVSSLEVSIDAMDIGSIRPFWKAVLAYVDDPADPGPSGAIVDPAGQLPAIWFQQMEVPRPQRNRIHLDVTVPHDEAEARTAAAVAAGGRLIDDSHARSFWVLADREGNECCVCTWLDRDERDTASG